MVLQTKYQESNGWMSLSFWCCCSFLKVDFKLISNKLFELYVYDHITLIQIFKITFSSKIENVFCDCGDCAFFVGNDKNI